MSCINSSGSTQITQYLYIRYSIMFTRKFNPSKIRTLTVLTCILVHIQAIILIVNRII